MPIIIANNGVLCGHDYWDGNSDGLNVMRCCGYNSQACGKDFFRRKKDLDGYFLKIRLTNAKLCVILVA